MRRAFSSYGLLLSFRAAAIHESFSRAATDLNVTHGAVSRAIRQLESDLGTALFERRNRRVFLTDDGRELAEAVEIGFGRIEQAAASIRDKAGKAVVRLSCEPTLLMRWLIPRTGQFSDRHPDIDLQLIAGGGPVMLGPGIDLAIRRADFNIPDIYEQIFLFAEEIGPVCSVDKTTAFFEAGTIRSDATLLHTQTRPDAWRDWLSIDAEHKRPLLAGPTFEHFYLSLQACIAGQGVAIGPKRLVEDSLRDGTLTAPLGFKPDGSKYFLLAAKTDGNTTPVSSVRRWLIDLFTTNRR